MLHHHAELLISVIFHFSPILRFYLTYFSEYMSINQELDELTSFVDNLENQSTSLHDKVKDFLEAVKSSKENSAQEKK